MPEHSANLAHHFEDIEQQRNSAELGMWLFSATELMFFGGLFLAYLIYRNQYFVEFSHASHTLSVTLGTINTAVLLTSSLTMALAVNAARASQRKQVVYLLLATAALGTVFLCVKAYEYHHKFEEHHIPFARLPFEWPSEELRGATMFFNLYFVMTGVHALHMVIGVVMMLILAVLARRGELLGKDRITVHNAGLYWHFVDLVWVYLFPFVPHRCSFQRRALEMTGEHSSAVPHTSTKPYFVTMAALMVLLFVTVAVAEADFGNWAFPIAVLIATVKAVLILLFFMHLLGSRPIIWLFAASGFFWLAILIVLTLSDFFAQLGRCPAKSRGIPHDPDLTEPGGNWSPMFATFNSPG